MPSLPPRILAALDQPVASCMRTDCARLTLGQTVGEALTRLRLEQPAERIIYFYVVDGQGRLVGIVPTRQLLRSPADQLVDGLMVKRLVTLPAQAAVRNACELFALHRLLALPVVDAQQRLLGVVDIQLYTDELEALNDAEQRSALFQAMGVYAAEPSTTSTIGAFGRRFPWLGCNIAGGMICALLGSRYEAELHRVVALALFIPVVLNLAESVASQSVSLTLHLLRGELPSRSAVLQGLRQEASTGALLGGACGLVVGGAALAWLRAPAVALVLVFGIASGVALSALLGLLIPMALRLLRLDPKVAAGPIALAGADVATMLAYLSLARWLLR